MTRITRSRRVDVPASVAWDVVTDHELYGEVAPNLSSVEVLDGEGEREGEGMVRRCVDVDGNEWTETCTRWVPGRGFAVAVDVAGSPFHRRLFTRFEGEWRVAEASGGTVVTVAFDFEPRFGPLGVLVSRYVQYRARPLVEAILDAWETEMAARAADARDRSAAVDAAGAVEPRDLRPGR